MVDHLIYNKQKYYPFNSNPAGSYTIEGETVDESGLPIGGGEGDILVNLTISKDGKLTVTSAMGGEGDITKSTIKITKNS